MISLERFLDGVEQNVSRIKEYHQPGDGSEGQCDCIGLIIGAKRLAGGKWAGIHGSNYAARSEMTSFDKIPNVKALFLGEVVYKHMVPGERSYSLPEKYQEGGKRYNGDLNDYYHVGVVTNLNPLIITHCTSPGPIARDTKLGKWSHGGMLKDIDYGDAGNTSASTKDEVKLMVILRGGNERLPINLRANRSISSTKLDEIPQGAEVTLLEMGTEWSRVIHNGITGYVLSTFVHNVNDTGDSTPVSSGSGESELITVSRAELERVYDTLGDLLGLRG
jgi:hypothetical protein